MWGSHHTTIKFQRKETIRISGVGLVRVMTNPGTIYLEVIGSCVSFVELVMVRPTIVDVEGSARLIVAYMWSQWLAFLRINLKENKARY